MRTEVTLPARLTRLVERNGACVRVGLPLVLRPFMRGVIGLTLRKTIYLRESVLTADELEFERLLVHELEHVRQVTEHGLIRFLYLYFRDFSENLARGLSFNRAYEEIAFEREARIAEDHFVDQANRQEAAQSL